MRKVMLAALVVTCVGVLAQGAGAATIEVENLEVNGGIEAQGEVFFEVPFFSISIVCDKTIRGRLNARVVGNLVLGGNNAGTVEDIRINQCRGGTAEAALVTAAAPARLSWLRVTERSAAELAALDVAIRIEDPGFGTCLYRALLNVSSRAEAGGRFTTLRLRLVRFLTVTVINGMCPGEAVVTVTGTLVLKRPAAGVGLRLAP